MKTYKQQDLAKMNDRDRARFVNCLSGFKSANVIGTRDRHQQNNLAMISSVVHLGSNPPLLGFVMRPQSVTRHTWENIEESGVYTINQVNENFFRQAHQTSARYPRETSEFEACGLTPEFVDGFHAPYVAESSLRIGMQQVEIIPIQHNDTALIVGEVRWVEVKEEAVKSDGFIDIESLGTMTISGLDGYHRTQRAARLSYAKPDEELSELDAEGEPKD
ncbi:flavin reductase family protein [Idiomarina loihiensis]|jgi:flavin reductase (DIM6/NTAB) family NADH-FMN oxidoreductase RutF|uniref:Conserved domain associated with flavoprotein oxygenases, DIM6/NTAB family n=1 Tax=Idiomarina loihiensis (strain ATCC BAA-735 / DSM 15497 / L2-TR) TaxID=283942 RepID=Q5QU77_IDILO|nr:MULTISPECIES: flavin reductase family protein [Idiomarina]AAV82388.1 Conserved domain associated with flavoprotein oxygenases, DIM6/NTAB family [Idiomarina loihiensis L2TR]AGM36422.1 flavoprotein oxygenase domain-containing protein [Idiomarina loihiensis GSL 199]NWO03028.1 flavin reductase [Idiomarinaceae bacterium]TDO53830.1 flavin reductase (DIM6/NTAB) family NADH-FMN oxidoreductase RutF [Idiomarina sp. 017G]|tara:strand:+ start:428 stop:1084 length:657 start_codon:yes stop_codon:yes gene_type:complete